MLETIAEKNKPTIAIVINVRAIVGKLLDKTVELNLSPPNNIGIQPITAMIKALVAQE